MSRIGHNFRAAEELPIPEDVQPGPGWTERMVEMAAHIGAYPTLLLIERFGGKRIYVPSDWTRGKTYEGLGSIRDVIGDQAARILSDIYRQEYFWVPVGKAAIARARRAPILAAVRAGQMTGGEAQRLLGTSRSYLAHLVNQTDEGLIGGPAPTPRLGRMPGQLDFFSDE